MIFPQKDNKYLPFTREPSKMEANLIHALILKVLSSLILGKEESSKAGTKDLPP